MDDPESEFTATDSGGGDGGAGDGHACIGVDNYCEYGSPKEEPESKYIDICYHPVKEELGNYGSYDYDPPKEEPELAATDDGGGDGDVDGNYDPFYVDDPPKEEPEAEFAATSDGADDGGSRDVGYECSHCRTSLSTRKFKVEHELRCKTRMRRKELESQVTEVYHCGYCRCPFVNEEHKERHQRRYCRKRPVAKKKPSNDPYYACDECDYFTKWKWNLRKHLLTHNKNNAEWFTCTQCPYKTVHKYCMIRHTEIHNNIFSYCCSICGKSFRFKSSLDEHLVRQHFDESDEVSKLITSKIYTCDICKQFRTIKKTSFNEHLAITHLKGVGVEKYECPRCSYSTFSKGNLRKHLKTHAEQKDYRCIVCKKQFAQKMELDSHILYIHPDNVDLVKTITSKIHRCESCSFKTVRKDNLKCHVQSKHI